MTTKTNECLKSLIEEAFEDAVDALRGSAIRWGRLELQDCSGSAVSRLEVVLAEWLSDQVWAYLYRKKADWAGIKALVKMWYYYKLVGRLYVDNDLNVRDHVMLSKCARATKEALFRALIELPAIENIRRQVDSYTPKIKNKTVDELLNEKNKNISRSALEKERRKL